MVAGSCQEIFGVPFVSQNEQGDNTTDCLVRRDVVYYSSLGVCKVPNSIEELEPVR